jgi:peptidoglycan/xylan/chitin deacetylase (PgdA/CDA1 family)
MPRSIKRNSENTETINVSWGWLNCLWMATCLAAFASGCAGIAPDASTPTASTKPALGPTTVSLTFDDGDADNYTVREQLSSHEMHATFYINSGLVGDDTHMTWDQLQALYTDGNEIGGHTLTHDDLTEIGADDLRRQVCDDRFNLFHHGFQPVSFAYPFGHYNTAAQQTVAECGYNSARSVINGPEMLPPTDLYALGAMPYIVEDTSLHKIKQYVSAVIDGGGGWVILIFHHVCDGCDEFSVKPDTFAAFLDWLPTRYDDGLVVKTVGEVVGGPVKPPVSSVP